MVDYAPLSKVWTDVPTKPTSENNMGSSGKSKKKGSTSHKDTERRRERVNASSTPNDFENIFDKFLNERSFTNMDTLYPKMAKENTYNTDFPPNVFMKQDPKDLTQNNEPEGVFDDDIGVDNSYRFDDLLKDNKLTAFGHDAPLDLSVDNNAALKQHKNMSLYDGSRKENPECSPMDVLTDEADEAAKSGGMHEDMDGLPSSEEEQMRRYYDELAAMEMRQHQKNNETGTHIFNLVLYTISGIFMIFMFELVHMLARR